MANNRKIGIFFLIFIIFFGVSFYYASENGLRGPIEKEEKNTEIKTYAIQTSEYYEKIDNYKFVITSKEELQIFNTVYKGNLKLSKVDFGKNKVFVQLEVASSGSIQKEVTDLIIDTNIVFVIKTKAPEAGTDDMALWYYVAIVPDNELDGVYYDDFQNPSDVITVSQDYYIHTDSKYLTMRDDGGSNTDIYYRIDPVNQKIEKIIEIYEANLTGTPDTNLSYSYEKDFDKDDLTIIDELYSKEDIKDTDIPYSINGKDIYNSDSISVLKALLEKYDNA